MIGVALAVETLSWTDLPSVFAHRLRRRWTEVPQQSSSPNTAPSRIGQGMEILGIKKGTIQKSHTPPNYVVEDGTTQRKPPEVRIWTLRNQSRVGTRPPSTSTPHFPACWARC